MYKKFFGFVLICFLAACKNEEEITNSNSGSVDKYAASKAMILDLVTTYGNYDVESVPQLLGGKLWDWTEHYEYSENWNEMIFDLSIDGADGCGNIRYQFLSNGELRDYSTSCFKEYDTYRVGKWSFDPATHTLTINEVLNYHLIALSEDSFIVDHIDTWSSAYPRYFRQVFKAKTFE